MNYKKNLRVSLIGICYANRVFLYSEDIMYISRKKTSTCRAWLKLKLGVEWLELIHSEEYYGCSRNFPTQSKSFSNRYLKARNAFNIFIFNIYISDN